MKTSSAASRVLSLLVTFWGIAVVATAQVSNTFNAPPPPGYPAPGAGLQPSSRSNRQAAAAVQAPATSYPKTYPPPAGYTYPAPAGYAYPPPAGYTYLPPGYGMNPTVKPLTPKKTTSTSAKKSAAKTTVPKYVVGDLNHEVAKLVQNDKVQNKRLGDLERDVSSIKRSGKGSGSITRYDGGSDLTARTTHTVRPGDTLWGIANSHRVSVGEIQQLNRLSGEFVRVGQVLLIPSSFRSSSFTTVSYVPTKTSSSASYTVKKGDSLKAIAIRHKISTAALADANRIRDPNKLIVGQRLVIPGRSGVTHVASTSHTKTKTVPSASSDTIPLPGFGMPTTPAPAAPVAQGPTFPSAPAPAPAPAVAPAPTSAPAPTPTKSVPTDTHRGILAYRVDRSDTLESIAQQFSTTPDRVREMNHLAPSSKLKGGDEIMVPAMGAVSLVN